MLSSRRWRACGERHAARARLVATLPLTLTLTLTFTLTLTQVLGVSHVGRRSSFVRLGGDSIRALQVPSP